jgi:WD40 repeat protein
VINIAPIQTVKQEGKPEKEIRSSSAAESGDKSVNNGKLLLTLDGYAASVISAVFSPDGARLATGSYDGTIKIWDNTSGQVLLTLPPPA